MKILFLSSAFNGLTQRAWIELDRLNHMVSIHIAQEGQSMIEAAAQYKPDLIIAPYLKVRIPDVIWQKYICLVIHPGIVGDRGASSLDWAILNGETLWGVTILQAAKKMDSGRVWAFEAFNMRAASKSSLYRHEVTQAAIKALLRAIDDFPQPKFSSEEVKKIGQWRPRCTQSDYYFDWTDHTSSILTKIFAADSDPGVLKEINGHPYFLYGAHREEELKGAPGEILAHRHEAICIATGDGAIWISHLKKDITGAIKLPAKLVLDNLSTTLPNQEMTLFDTPISSQHEIKYEQEGHIGYLYFDFYNGAMDTSQCARLLEAIRTIKKEKDIHILVLLGGDDLWSNGIHLNVIEHSNNPAAESWANINALNDLILELINSTDHLVISALRGNAGGGGVSLALAADKILARSGIVLNPHTKNMGLYGSEYWTYLLPKRIGTVKAKKFTEECLPWGTQIAKEIGLIDEIIDGDFDGVLTRVKEIAKEIAQLPYLDKLILAKKLKRKKDERSKPLAAYREEELSKMRTNFFENNEGYHEKRFDFVHKIWRRDIEDQISNRDLYASRREIYRRRKSESLTYKE